MHDWPVTNARRFELYVRWSLYVMLLAMPAQFLLILGSAVGQPGIGFRRLLALFLLSLPLTACNLIAARWCLDRVMQGPAPMRRWFLVVWLMLLVAMCAVLLTQPFSEWMLLLQYPVACAVASISPRLSARTTGLISLAVFLVGIVLAMLGQGLAISGAVMLLVLIWAAWSTGWMLRVLRELQHAHETAAQLALAEERLRISRDLHDVFGRTLATISVKSELAAELSRRGHHDRAAAEIAQIRQIASTAGAEVRRVVRDERRTGWADEVEGARALLTSAGVACVIAGEDIPEAYAVTLAWVIREGVTNVLRHSRATRVTITTAVEPDEVALTVANDGASETGAATSSTGTGLRSMAERVQTIGGELEHRHDGDWFLLTASIPRVREGAHDPRPAG